MNPVVEVKTNPNATPESGRTDGGKTRDANSTKSISVPIAKDATLLFGATAGMPRQFRGNFDFQFVRTMGCTTYDGAETGECYETASRIEDEKEDSYTEAWRVTAERVEAIARKSFAGGHLVSAREAFLRASSYWREVGFYQSTTDPECRAGWERQRECFAQAGKLMDPPFEAVSIPYENGKSLPGYFLKADASNKPRPTLMSLGGADSLGEELYFWGGGAAALRRGYNALLFEIPGQRGAMYSNPGAELFFRPDTEVPLKYVCDWVLARSDVDPKRLALVGWSLGGYFAPRAAAFEKRVKACIASTTLPNWQNVVLGVTRVTAGSALPQKILRAKSICRPWGAGLSSRETYVIDMVRAAERSRSIMDGLSKYTLWGLEDKITCPYFNIGGQGEGQLAVVRSEVLRQADLSQGAAHHHRKGGR